jgi:hypothetical protein
MQSSPRHAAVPSLPYMPCLPGHPEAAAATPHCMSRRPCCLDAEPAPVCLAGCAGAVRGMEAAQCSQRAQRRRPSLLLHHQQRRAQGVQVRSRRAARRAAAPAPCLGGCLERGSRQSRQHHVRGPARRRLPAQAGGSPPRSLLRPHHGREANAVALLPGASGRTLACITGGEDCTLRVLLHPPGAAAPAGAVPATCSGEPSCFGGSLLLGEQASGASVRTMSLVPLGPPRSRRRSSGSGGSSSSSSSSGSSYKGSSAAAAGGAGEPAGACSSGQQWLLLAGGSKAVLSAWVLRWRHPPATVPAGHPAQATWQADTPGAPRTTSVARGAQPQLEWEWLGTRPPPGRGLRPKSLGVGLSTPVSDQRCLAVSAFLPSPADRPAASAGPACGAGVAFLVMASSDATLCMLALELERRAHGPNSGECSRAWQTVANLEYHQAPVLCTAHVATEAPAEAVAAAAPSASGIGSGVAPQAAPQRARRRHLVLSGASDGGVALWDLTGAAGGFAPARHGAAASGGDVPALRPALALPGLHRSGVNAISAVATGAVEEGGTMSSNPPALRAGAGGERSIAGLGSCWRFRLLLPWCSTPPPRRCPHELTTSTLCRCPTQARGRSHC